MRGKLAVLAAAAVALAGSTTWAASDALDAGLYASYQARADGKFISFSVCGRLPNTFGCYGGGNLTSFESGCAVLEGAPHTKGNVVTRAIYVLDRRVSDSDPVTLFVYTRTDTITDSLDTVFVGWRGRCRSASRAASMRNAGWRATIPSSMREPI
jgi:hypothetical protein